MGLKAVMDRNNVKGKDMAAGLHVAEETISRWRSNPRVMTGENLINARDFLRRYEPGLDVDDLLMTRRRRRARTPGRRASDRLPEAATQGSK